MPEIPDLTSTVEAVTLQALFVPISQREGEHVSVSAVPQPSSDRILPKPRKALYDSRWSWHVMNEQVHSPAIRVKALYLSGEEKLDQKKFRCYSRDYSPLQRFSATYLVCPLHP